MIMRIAFYYRKGSTTFGCMLPEEKERLHAFFAAEQKREAAKSLSRKLNHGDKKKINFFCRGLDIRVPELMEGKSFDFPFQL